MKQYIYFTDKNNKKKLLVSLLKNDNIDSALVFTRTKHEADKVAKDLVANKIAAQAIHGDKSQGARQLSLYNFSTNKRIKGFELQQLEPFFNYLIYLYERSFFHLRKLVLQLTCYV